MSTTEQRAEDIEATMRRVEHQHGVVGTVMVNKEGMPQMTTMDTTTTMQYINEISKLIPCATGVIRDLEPSNDLMFMRLKSKKQEIMVANDSEFHVIVIQQRE